jgi:hypothetical protein
LLNEFLEPRHDVRMLRGHVCQLGYLGVEVIEAPASMRHRHGSALAQVGALLGAGQPPRRPSMRMPEVKDDAFVPLPFTRRPKFLGPLRGMV